ncbi:MAG: MBL fold metallo-hydrolase [Dehalococcoidales bacterium]|nr:MBL fold metallo-hydrolase [Dehalococcoidales bacterium]
MEMSWLGHSCFRIKGKQTTVITDPYSPELGYTLGKQSARVVTVSHRHPGHCYVEGIGGEPKQVAGPGEYEIGGVLIIGIPSYHDEEKGGIRGKNTIYLMHMDDMSVCHLGDLGHALSDEQAEELDDVDVLLVPVGGVSTIDGSVAAGLVRQLAPKVVIPMHYQTEALKRELEPAARFLKEMGVQEITSMPKLSVTRSNMPAITQVYLLDY